MRLLLLLSSFLFAAANPGWAADTPPLPAAATPEPVYTNYHNPAGPWSIHVVQVPRANSRFEFHSTHAGKSAWGLSSLSAQIALLDPALGLPVAGLNGDFYRRDRAYAGDPRGLQIVEGEVISAPIGGFSFWVDALGQPYATNVASRFQVTWPDGTAIPFGLNEDRQLNRAVLYTPAAAPSTRTVGGRELVLERQETNPWLPLRMGRTYLARVREIREKGNTPLAPDIMVLSLGPALLTRLPAVATGAVLKITTDSSPDLRSIRTAISGGPVLLRAGKRQKLHASEGEEYAASSMLERHPRAAIGWNEHSFFLVEVDGRQRRLSVGMTLDELSAFLVELGCEDAMSLDGGGSATLWYHGEVRNSPCDGFERGIANGLVVVKKRPKPAPSATATAHAQ